jgi:hypothetical protein
MSFFGCRAPLSIVRGAHCDGGKASLHFYTNTKYALFFSSPLPPFRCCCRLAVLLLLVSWRCYLCMYVCVCAHICLNDAVFRSALRIRGSRCPAPSLCDNVRLYIAWNNGAASSAGCLLTSFFFLSPSPGRTCHVSGNCSIYTNGSHRHLLG